MSTIQVQLLRSLMYLTAFMVLGTLSPRILAMNEDYASPMKNPYIKVMMQAPEMSLVPPGDILDFFRDQYPLPNGLLQPFPEYDFVIVGAGSAGSVLAARLSEERSSSVLLLEAGKPETLFTETPILAPYFQMTSYTWPYTMERQENVCKAFVDGVCFWPRGRAVGGTSVINYMIYTRGFAEDWDRIAADGNYGWSYDDVLPYYLKSEGANLKKWKGSPYHNTSGELSVQDVPFRSRLAKAFLAAGEELGNRIVDYNSRDGFGFSYIQATMNRGHRHSAAKAFLHDNKKRKNLHILPEARALRVLIDKQSKTAHSVEYLWRNKIYVVRARREIILSAGPLASPQLLMLSGVGPSDHLQSLNIPVIQDLNVGATLYDHISLPGLTFVANTSRLTVLLKNIIHYRNSVSWLHYGDGPFSTLAGVETIGYIKTNISKEPGEYPDIELLGSCGSLASDYGAIVRRGIRLSDEVYNTVYKPLEDVEAFSIFPMLLHPKSKGYMRLRDKNPLSQPRFYGNYLTHPDDIATLIAAIRYIIRLTETKAYQRFGTRLHTIPFPGCRNYIFNSDGYWECVLRSMTATLHHQIATCKMGPRSDPDTVVDPELRVHGIRRLRVADTGIIPRTLCAHTNAPGIMIGEKAADLIKKTWYYLKG